MSASWMRCCLEKHRLRRRKKGRKALDERFGDLSISGPMEGGWNQAPSTATAQVHNLESFETSSSNCGHIENGCASSRRPKLNPSNQGPRAPPPSNNPALEKETEGSRPNSDKPSFVYKPASKSFFKNMAEIGKPNRRSSESSQGSNFIAGHKRQVSKTSTGSIEPPGNPDIPRHPSYHVLGPRHRSPSPGLPHPRRAVSPNTPPLDQKRYTLSPSATLRDSSTIEEENTNYSSGTDPEPSPKHPASPQPVFRTPVYPPRPKPKPLDLASDSRKQKRKTRAVTSEMVPSSADLFG